jgi:hypothetical protein
MALHVVFTPEGIPGWIGKEPREGSEVMPEEIRIGAIIAPVTISLLAGHMRDPANGRWKRRPKPPAPTAEEREAQRLLVQEQRREQRREERRQARDAALRERLFDRLVEVAARIDPDFAKAVAELEDEFAAEDEA